MAISEYIDVSITRDSTNPKAAAFDRLLILTNGCSFDSGELYREYASPTEADDDSDLTDVVRSMIAAAFAVEEHPETIIVGDLPTASGVKHTTRLTPASGALTLGCVVTSPAGVSTTIASSGVDAATALADFVSDLAAVTGLACTSDSGAALVVADNDGERWRFDDFVNVGVYADETASMSYDDALSALVVDGCDFYRITIDVNSPTNISEVAAWALANKKIFLAGPQLITPATYASTANALVAASNDHVLSIITKAGEGNGDAWPAVALGSLMSSKNPGSATYMFKELDGVQTDSWTTTEKAAIRAYKGVMYVSEAGVPITTEGWSHGGEYLDIIEGTYWLIARIEETLFGALAANDKIPFTDAGVAILQSGLEARLADAESDSFQLLEPGSSEVTTRRVSAVSAADRATRTYSHLNFTARYAGAIHYAGVNGSITV
jgi:hypothetical protein